MTGVQTCALPISVSELEHAFVFSGRPLTMTSRDNALPSPCPSSTDLRRTHMKPAPPVTRMFLTPGRSAFFTLPMRGGACAGDGAWLNGLRATARG